MTQEEKDLLMAKVLNEPDTLTDQEIHLLTHDRELREAYHLAVLLKSGAATVREKKSIRMPRWAAAIIVILSLGAVAATITYHATEQREEEPMSSDISIFSKTSTGDDAMAEAILLPDTLTINNLPLADIATQITAIYGSQVVFADSETAGLRLYFTLPKGSSVEDFVKIIDEYEALAATINGDTITIQKQEARK